MAVSNLVAASSGKTRYVTTLNSGTSWTVPSGVTYVNATLIGGGGSAGPGGTGFTGASNPGLGGQIITTTVSTTPGASIAYSIGAGGSQVNSGWNGNAGGTTTFTGATSAVGGNGGMRVAYVNGGMVGPTSQAGMTANNGGGSVSTAGAGSDTYGGPGGAGQIIIEYWA